MLNITAIKAVFYCLEENHGSIIAFANQAIDTGSEIKKFSQLTKWNHLLIR